MKKILLTIMILVAILHSDSITDGKKFYRPTEIVFSIAPGTIFKKYERVYTIEQTYNKHIKNKMGNCITKYEIFGILHAGCEYTFNTILLYTTIPKGIIRKDIVEYYHDMPLLEYEKQVNMIKKDEKLIQRYRNNYNNHLQKKLSSEITNNVLDSMREDNRRLREDNKIYK